MNLTEARALLLMLGLAHDRTIPEGLDSVWAATLDDLPFALAKDAVVELVKTSPYLPKVAEVRNRARLIREQRQRDTARHRQLEARNDPRPDSGRTGARMCAHVLARLADAGQNTAEGKFLGKQRAADIAETAVREWLDLHPAA